MAGSSIRSRGLACAFALGLLGGIAPTTIAVPATPTDVVAPLLATDFLAGALTIEPGDWSSTAEVTLHLQPSPTDDPQLLISNDGATWVTVPFAATVAWSLIDPEAGGTDADGGKTVRVQYGDGVSWDYYTSATVILDRAAPSVDDVTGVTIDGRLWSGTVDGPGATALPYIAETRFSLDGGATWQPWAAGNVVDVWNTPGAAAWAAGDLAMDVQLRDAAGNTSDPISTTATIDTPDYSVPVWDTNLAGVTVETPLPAITGRPFTIRIHYPDGYTLPSNAWCQWLIHWGDDASILDNPNPTWGELFIERSKANNACNEWTFTLPYRAARQFSWMIQVGTKNANTHPMDLVTAIVGTNQVVFRALDGSHDERFLTSTIPFAYVLPETTISQAGDPVTYRLHTVGTSTVPQSGMWWTYPLNCYINPHWSQDGGNTYTYRPNCDGPWVTGWTGVMANGYMRSQYDPLVDGRAPTVSAPVVRLATGGLSTSVRGTVTWSGRDRGSGMRGYEVQQSRNGGPWRAVTLPTSMTTSLSRSFTLGNAYRYRARARDRVGNWSKWVTGLPIRTALYQETNPALRWTGTWAKVTGAAFSGGSAKASTTAGTSVRITATTLGLAWVTRRGPGRGLAQVWVDGKLAMTVDLGAPTLGGRTVVYARSWTKAGTHTLRIVPLATDGRPLVELDAFVVAR